MKYNVKWTTGSPPLDGDEGLESDPTFFPLDDLGDRSNETTENFLYAFKRYGKSPGLFLYMTIVPDGQPDNEIVNVNLRKIDLRRKWLEALHADLVKGLEAGLFKQKVHAANQWRDEVRFPVLVRPRPDGTIDFDNMELQDNQ